MLIRPFLISTGASVDSNGYTWFKFTNPVPLNLISTSGIEIALRAGDLYGVREATRSIDDVLILTHPRLIFKLARFNSEELIVESLTYTGKIILNTLQHPQRKTSKKPSKIKIEMSIQDQDPHKKLSQLPRPGQKPKKLLLQSLPKPKMAIQEAGVASNRAVLEDDEEDLQPLPITSLTKRHVPSMAASALDLKEEEDGDEDEAFFGDKEDVFHPQGFSESAAVPGYDVALYGNTEAKVPGVYVKVDPSELSVAKIARLSRRVHYLDVDVKDLHVTVLYSKNEELVKKQPKDRSTTFRAFLKEFTSWVGHDGKTYLVGLLDSVELSAANQAWVDLGYTTSYPDYLPHVTLKVMDEPHPRLEDAKETLNAFLKKRVVRLVFGPEKIEPLRD